MPLYRKRPGMPIEARQFILPQGPALAEWCGGTFVLGKATGQFAERTHILVPARHGNVAVTEIAYAGDWIVKNEDGFIVYFDQEFRATYQEVRDYEEAVAPV